MYFLVCGSNFKLFDFILRFLGLINHLQSKKYDFRPDSGGRPQSEFGRIRAAVPNLSSAGFGRTGGFGRIRADGRVRPDSGGGRNSQDARLNLNFEQQSASITV